MFQSKFTKCAILLGMLLVLFLSPSLVSGVPLIPDDNVTVRCTTFYEEVRIGYIPGEISVGFRGNFISENSVEQLTLVIRSSSENFDISSIEIVHLPAYGGEIRIEQLESELHYENYYLHKFRLLFNPPFKEIEIVIIYDTVLEEWVDEDTMLLSMPSWSPKIMLENHGDIVISGPDADEFRLSSATTTIGDVIPEYSDFFRVLSFTLESSKLVDFQYTYFWISAAYTPASLSLKAIWDQYKNVEEILQRSNQLLERSNELLQRSNQLLEDTRKALYVTLFGIFMTILGMVAVIKRKWLTNKWKKLARALRK